MSLARIRPIVAAAVVAIALAVAVPAASAASVREQQWWLDRGLRR